MLVNEVLKHLLNIPEDNFPQVLREEDGPYIMKVQKSPCSIADDIILFFSIKQLTTMQFH